MVQILHVRAPEGAYSDAQISHMRWYNPQTGEMNVATQANMIQFIVEQKGVAYVCDGAHVVPVIVAPIVNNEPYVTCLIPGGLLALPRF